MAEQIFISCKESRKKWRKQKESVDEAFENTTGPHMDSHNGLHKQPLLEDESH